jgi:hypothetical protein
MDRKMADPGILELAGEIADLLGLAERIQRVLPTQRLKVRRKHRRVEKLLKDFKAALDDARTALRVLSSTLEAHLPETEDHAPTHSRLDLPRIAFSLPENEVAVYRRGVEQLQGGIRKMTNAAYDLEATASGVPNEVQRFYRISENGRAVLQTVRSVLDDHPEELIPLLHRIEEYLSSCSQLLEDRREWLDS